MLKRKYFMQTWKQIKHYEKLDDEKYCHPGINFCHDVSVTDVQLLKRK